MKYEETTVHITVTKEQLLHCFMAETTEEFDRRMKQLANDMQLKIEKELFKKVMNSNRCDADAAAADVQPVKHGRWAECYTDSHHCSYICSVCGRASIKSLTESLYKYCPKCGADMREE